MKQRQIASVMRRVLLALSCAAALACGGEPTAPNKSPTSIRLQSDAEDSVGSGKTYDYSLANAVLIVSARTDTFAIHIQGDEEWTGVFTIPNTLPRLEPGFYYRATRFPYNDPARPGLSWFGANGCDSLTGSFTIADLSYTGTSLTAIDLSFEQHCEGLPAALRGSIHWRADDPTRPPGPVTPVPAGLWHPAPGETPTTGNFIYLRSDPGDYIGGGVNYTYTPATATVALTTSPGRLTVAVGGSNVFDSWDGVFGAMNTRSTLEVGYYPDLERFVNPTRGGLDWSGAGRGCNTLRGWFAIDQVTYTADTVTAVDLRFEQHCEGATPALRGAIHWVR
ncbi:MAG TPA: hypothetical protein VEO58_11545 [Gemmatimonadales bacterium]|nr:hypothetical protein [Gemmatimonadales bacterium]